MIEGNNDVIIGNICFKRFKQKGNDFNQKCRGIFIVSAIGLLLYAFFMDGLNDIVMLSTLESEPLYVKEKSYVLAFTLLLPTLLSLLFIMVLASFYLANDKLFLFFAKSGFWTLPLFFLALLPINYLAEQHLENHGYSYCDWYSGKRPSNPDIWVREPEYCQQSNKSVIFDMFVWLDKRVAENNEPSPAEVNVFLTDGLKKLIKKSSL